MVELYASLTEVLEPMIYLLIDFPVLAPMVAAALLAAAYCLPLTTNPKRLVATCAAVWVLYATYEFVIFVYGHQTGFEPIRNDMLFFGPPLIFLAVFGGICAVVGIRDAT